MFSKILHGQFELKTMFWKYGVWGMFLLTFITYLLRIFLVHQLKGMTLTYYYINVFSFINMNNLILFLTISYFTLFAAMVFYAVILTLGIFRSSAEYDKSTWLRQMARIFILVIIFFAFKTVL
ncbi:MAG: hypothetical protein IJS26_06350 [Alphaproteobacteria bacterium]|nr:hypothetical protein [Alphaproteobacteria bacterium]